MDEMAAYAQNLETQVINQSNRINLALLNVIPVASLIV